MSVFTPVSFDQLREFLRRYPLGAALSLQGIGEGVENSNFFVDTVDGRYVLTLFERLNYADLPFFLGLMDHLAARGIPCPRPLKLRDGSMLTELNGKPAAMVNRLTGGSELFVGEAHCAAVGDVLARMHLAGLDYPGGAVNPRGPQWRRDTAQAVLGAVPADTARTIRDELAAQQALDLAALPRGVIHADLFKDNVLFVKQELSGVIDFYYACVDALLYDLAVTVNDWCFDVHGAFVEARYRALLQAYAARRALGAAERAAWPLALRAAAFRFFLSRLQDWHFPRAGDVVHRKNPAEYGRILDWHRTHGAPAI